MLNTQIQIIKKMKLKKRAWLNAKEMNALYPKTFDCPSDKDIASIESGDHAKIACDGERFWVHVIKIEDGWYKGVIDNNLVRTRLHGLKYGDPVQFQANNILSTLKKENNEQRINCDIHSGK